MWLTTREKGIRRAGRNPRNAGSNPTTKLENFLTGISLLSDISPTLLREECFRQWLLMLVNIYLLCLFFLLWVHLLCYQPDKNPHKQASTGSENLLQTVRNFTVALCSSTDNTIFVISIKRKNTCTSSESWTQLWIDSRQNAAGFPSELGQDKFQHVSSLPTFTLFFAPNKRLIYCFWLVFFFFVCTVHSKWFEHALRRMKDPDRNLY